MISAVVFPITLVMLMKRNRERERERERERLINELITCISSPSVSSNIYLNEIFCILAQHGFLKDGPHVGSAEMKLA